MTMDIKRRQLLVEPGEGLLLVTSSLSAATRLADWSMLTGLNPSQSIFGELCAMPLPIYTSVPPDGRQFAEVKPEVMWHPLFWLPKRIAGRYNLPTGPNGELEPETNSVWSIRVALELTASGLYSQDEGWMDVLGTAGIDVDNEADLERIRKWQGGSRDTLLDAIDLAPYLHLDENPSWALQSALVLEEPATQAQWAIYADSLLEMLWEAGQDPAGPLADHRSAVRVVAELAGVQLADIPAQGHSAADFWKAVSTELHLGKYDTKPALVEGPVAAAEQWLLMTRDTYWGSVTDLQSLTGGVENEWRLRR